MFECFTLVFLIFHLDLCLFFWGLYSHDFIVPFKIFIFIMSLFTQKTQLCSYLCIIKYFFYSIRLIN